MKGVMVCFAVVAALLLFGQCSRDSDSPGRYTPEECNILRFIALDDNNPDADEAAAKYAVHCQ